MKRQELANVIAMENRKKNRNPEEVEKEIDLTEVAVRRGHLGRKITVRVRGMRPSRQRKGGQHKR